MSRLSNHSRCLALLGLTLAWSSPGLAAQDALLVGNSFIMSNQPHGITGVLSGLRGAQGGFEGATLTDVSKGGYTLTMHAGDASGDGALNTYLVTGESTDHAYRSVVLQEQSQTAGFHIADNPFGPGYMWDESLVAVEYLNGLISARGADTVVLMTWGYRDGDASIPADLFDGYPDYTAMQTALIDGYEMYADTLSTVSRTAFVAPAGRAFQRVFDDLVAEGLDPLASGSPFSDLYSGDGRHPALEGSYLAGCVLYATLTGRDPRRASWAPSGISEARRALLQAAAAAVTIEDPYAPRTLAWGDARRYPFVSDYSDLVPSGATNLHLGAPDLRPTALLDRIAAPLETLVLGDQAGDAGRLGVFEGGRLTVGGALTVGASGDGLLEVMGGELRTGSLHLAVEAGSVGTLNLAGGLLQTGSLGAGAGESLLSVTGGTLRASALSIPLTLSAGTWEVPELGSAHGAVVIQPAGTLALSLAEAPSETPRLTLNGEATLSGTLLITPNPDAPVYSGRYTLIAAPSLITDGMVLDVSQLGDVEVDWEVTDPRDDVRLLVLTISGGSEPARGVEDPLDTVAQGPDPEPNPDPERGPEDEDSVGGLDDSVHQGPPESEPPGPSLVDASGCASQRGRGAPLWLGLAAPLWGLLRRRYVAIRSQASMIRFG
jgi:hypothetical protein